MDNSNLIPPQDQIDPSLSQRLIHVLLLFGLVLVLSGPSIITYFTSDEPKSIYTYHRSIDLESVMDIPELITHVDQIVIGEVGRKLAVEYPELNNRYQYSDEEWEEQLSVDPDFYKRYQNAYTEIRRIETLKGSVDEYFPIIRPDVEYYISSDLSLLKEGEIILFFLVDGKDDRSEFAKNYEAIYTPWGENGIFDVDGNRAFPRFPYAFKDNNETYYNRTNASRPFFELDKLREVIAGADK